MTSHQNHPGEDVAEDLARGEDLAALLERLLSQAEGKTQKDLAREAGISYQTLNAWANRTRGTSRIDPDRLRALAGTFRKWGVTTTPREFFAAVGRPAPGPSNEEREARLLWFYRQLPDRQQRLLVEDAEVMFKVVRVGQSVGQ
ncbi:helix-turn-helix domain-containing protein [Streptomyces tagetis]|uniref:helix-turn-helix domain-containing protein n=1 Tax=Streptomyces tagetis TaxID=2820809 RepID=UPI0027DD7CF9|nr:helix-turn-helix transcriptional regulator [Streptomyces sp. RG38]